MTDIIDMSQFVEAKSDQLNADDLIGISKTITVRKVAGAEGDQPIAVYYEGDNGKPFKPCKTMRRVLLAVWGRYAADYVGRQMTVYRDDGVTFGGLEVGGIRISHMSHIDKETLVVVAKSKGKKAGIKIKPLAIEQRSANPAREKAETWARDHIAAIETADELAAMMRDNARIVDKLAREHPDLHAQVVAAYDARLSETADPETGEIAAEGAEA